MLTGLLEPSAGEARLLGEQLDARNLDTRRRVGYMSQSFSLYSELSVRQNLELHARLFQLEPGTARARIDELMQRFGLDSVMDSKPGALPLGIKQRLQLAVAVLHRPDVLILDEPTSGVDPVARDGFWELIIELSRRDGVTIFITTHFMNEAQRCDRISLMHAGRILASDAPAVLIEQRGVQTLEDAFISYLEEASGVRSEAEGALPEALAQGQSAAPASATPGSPFSLARMLSFSAREATELRRDPIRLTLALLGTLILMLVIGYGINMDIEDLDYAVLDHDQSIASQRYALQISGSRYFREQTPLTSYADLDRRLKSGQIVMALELPPGFGRDLARGDVPEVGLWLDGLHAHAGGGGLQLHLRPACEAAERSPGPERGGQQQP